MPTPEQHRAVSLEWLSWVKPTLMDQWPKELAALSFPTVMVKVPHDLIDELWALHEQKPPGPVMTELARELDGLIGWDRKFVRLNSRSPKDSPWPFASPGTVSGKEAVLLLAGSMRTMDDLSEFHYLPEQPAYVCLREWQYGLRTEDEYRCFVKDGELIAVTAYGVDKPFTAPEDGGKRLRSVIDSYFNEVLKPVLHIDTVVFDVWMRGNEPRLIEINPFGSSDPCFFGTYENVLNAKTSIQFEHVDVPVVLETSSYPEGVSP